MILTESLSVLMPQMLDIEKLARFAWELGQQPKWIIERAFMAEDTM